MVTNEERAAAAETAVRAFCEAKEGNASLYDEKDTVVLDLVCDLLHYADLDKHTPFELLTMAGLHHEQEAEEDR